MKGLIVALLLTVSVSAMAQHPLRWYPFQKRDKAVEMSFKDSTLFLAPSVAFDVFTKQIDTGDYSIGVIPGVGYGLKWNPFKWEDDYLLGVDIFAEAAMSEDDDVFNIRVLPVVTFMNWIHIGYGTIFRVGLNGKSDNKTGVFTIGISKTL